MTDNDSEKDRQKEMANDEKTVRNYYTKASTGNKKMKIKK